MKRFWVENSHCQETTWNNNVTSFCYIHCCIPISIFDLALYFSTVNVLNALHWTAVHFNTLSDSLNTCKLVFTLIQDSTVHMKTVSWKLLGFTQWFSASCRTTIHTDHDCLSHNILYLIDHVIANNPPHLGDIRLHMQPGLYKT